LNLAKILEKTIGPGNPLMTEAITVLEMPGFQIKINVLQPIKGNLFQTTVVHLVSHPGESLSQEMMR
jgi:hypothetical protein